MAVQITIDQVAAPVGIPGFAREDLVLGQPVTLTSSGGPFSSYLWRFIYKPIDINSNTRSGALLATPTAAATLVAPIDVEGTYHVELVVDSGSGLGATPNDVARITFYAGSPLALDPGLLPRRVPAFNETTEHNVPDAIDPLGNPEGWSREWLRWFEVIRRMVAGQSTAWGRVQLPSGGPASLLSSSGVASVVRTGVGKVSVAFPAALPNANYAVEAEMFVVGGSLVVLNETVNGFDVERADPFGVLVDADFAFAVQVRP